MELTKFFKAVLDEDKSPVVICDLSHKIIYMNPAACKRYSSRGGAGLLGSSLLDCHNSKSNEMIYKILNGSKKANYIIEFILLTMRKKIKMFIWLRCAMNRAN